MCPKGFDPVQELTGFYTLDIQTSASSGYLSGNMRFDFNSEFFLFPANVSQWSATACVNSFESLHGVSRVSCSHSATAYPGGGANYTVMFEKFPLKPYENNHFTNNGNPTLSAFKCASYNAKAGRRGRVSCALSITTPTTTAVPGEFKSEHWHAY